MSQLSLFKEEKPNSIRLALDGIKEMESLGYVFEHTWTGQLFDGDNLPDGTDRTMAVCIFPDGDRYLISWDHKAGNFFCEDEIEGKIIIPLPDNAGSL